MIQIDEVLRELLKFYCKLWHAENPDVESSANVVAAATLCVLEETGDAVQNIGPDGIVTWKATPKFLDSIGCQPGPLVTLESTLNRHGHRSNR
jgi:hypothetical protein